MTDILTYLLGQILVGARHEVLILYLFFIIKTLPTSEIDNIINSVIVRSGVNANREEIEALFSDICKVLCGQIYH